MRCKAATNCGLSIIFASLSDTNTAPTIGAYSFRKCRFTCTVGLCMIGIGNGTAAGGSVLDEGRAASLGHFGITVGSRWDLFGIAAESPLWGRRIFICDQNKTGMTKQCVRIMCQTHAQPRACVSRTRCSFSIFLCRYVRICIYL